MNTEILTRTCKEFIKLWFGTNQITRSARLFEDIHEILVIKLY